MDIVTENFIKTRFPEDQWAPYEDCLSIFSQTSGDQVEAILLDIISQEEHYERNDLLTHFHETCCNFLTAMIKEMGVFVVTDAALSFLVRLYNALDALGDHQDKETLIQICQMQETDIMDQFFELVFCTAYFTEHEIHENVESVNPDIFKKVLAIARQGNYILAAYDQDESARLGVIVKSFKDLCMFFESRDFLAIKIIEHGGLVGAQFRDYYTPYIAEFQNMTVDQLARELMVMLAMSRDGNINPVKTLEAESEFIFDSNVELSMKIRHKIIELQAKFNNYLITKAQV